MAIKNKDGSVYKLREPNKLGKTQDNIDDKQLKFHNFTWEEIHAGGVGSVVRQHSDFGKIKNAGNVLVVAPTTEKVVSRPKPIEKVEPVFKEEPAIPESESVEEKPQDEFVAVKEEETPRYDIPHLKHKTMFHCLPAIQTSSSDDFYGDSWTRLQYGEKFIFPGVMLEKTDLAIQFWTTDPRQQVVERSVIYAFAYETWDTDTNRYHRVPYTEYRWWRVTGIEKKDGGFLFTAVPSDFQPDFSDPS